MSLFQCCHLYWCTSRINSVTHLALSLSPLSVFLFHSLLALSLYVLILPFHVLMRTRFNHVHLCRFSSSSHLYLSLASSHTLTPLGHVIFFLFFFLSTCTLQLLASLPSFIEWPLSYDHLSPCSHSSFPFPSLSISLGGPAFLPGFCRPRCEN